MTWSQWKWQRTGHLARAETKGAPDNGTVRQVIRALPAEGLLTPAYAAASKDDEAALMTSCVAPATENPRRRPADDRRRARHSEDRWERDMTERQIELAVNQRWDELYDRWKAGEITDREYRTLGATIDEWANAEYAKAGAELVD